MEADKDAVEGLEFMVFWVLDVDADCAGEARPEGLLHAEEAEEETVFDSPFGCCVLASV